jgi:CheY-like chemotaxis protein
MASASLAGRTVLVVEDEPLLALHICDQLQREGASVLSAHTLSVGLQLADHPDVSVAVLDFGLSDGDGTAICERLKGRGVPFVLHSGYDHVPEACPAGIVLPKPATPEQLVGFLPPRADSKTFLARQMNPQNPDAAAGGNADDHCVPIVLQKYFGVPPTTRL